MIKFILPVILNTGEYIFSQVVSFLDPNDFKKCVDKHNGNYKVKEFSCWHQLLCMMLGQLGNRDSLSDLLIALKAHQNKWYHLGLGSSISKSNLAYSNEHRSWRVFADFATMLIAQAKNISEKNSDLKFVSKSPVYAIDTTTIDLCLSVFWWAKFRKQKGAIKLPHN